jgi:ribonuclease VapC
MIAVDISALMAIALGETKAEACIEAIDQADALVISAATVAEALIVAGRRGVGEDMSRLFGKIDFTVSPVTGASARRVAEAYDAWGKGKHKAGLSFGDCFSYEVARENDCPLLYVGDDFARTDIRSVL